MRFLSLFAVFLVSPLFAQGNIKVETEISGPISRKIVPVAIVSDDPILGGLVQFALSTHGAIEISPSSPIKVRIGRGGLAAVVSCDNALCAFTSNVEGKDEDQLALRVADAAIVGLGRRWQLKPLFADTKVAFVSRSTGSAEIYVTNLARSKTLRLTRYGNTSIGPRWSADGSRIFFISSFRSNWPEIFSTNGYGEAAKVIINVRGALGAASSGPDGRIAFASSNKGTMDIFVAGPQGQTPTRVIKAPSMQWVNTDPSWSPDGSRFALTAGPTGSPGITLASSSGGALQRVPTGHNYSTEPRWNPVVPNQLVFTYQEAGSLRLGVLDLAANTSTPIVTKSPVSIAHASWCADGRHLVAAQGNGLVVVDSVTGKVTRLTPSQLGDCSEPDCWTPRAQ
jgi:TolB protein